MPPLIQWLGPILTAAHLQLVRYTLQPYFNALPLSLHRLETYAALALVSVAVRAVISPLSPSPATLCFAAAYGAALPALAHSGRWVGEAAGALGPEWGAVVAQVALAAPVVCALFPLCVPPVTRAGALRPIVAVCASAIPITLTAWASDVMEKTPFLVSTFAEAPELGLLGMGVVFNALSVVFLWAPIIRAPAASVPATAVESSPVADERKSKKSLKAGEQVKATEKALAKAEAEAPARQHAAAERVIRPSPSAFSLGLRVLPLLTAAAGFMAYQEAPFTSDGVRIHSSVASVSGRVIVGDNVEAKYRYLRADRALVGGVWIHDVPGDTTGVAAKLGDSIFATMPLQEIALLARTPAENDPLLVIGLGAGIGASYFTRRGLAVDVVEYDEAVYDAARDHFELGQHPPRNVYFEDGGLFVHKRAKALRGEPLPNGEVVPKEKYAYIVHDVFSAGGMPAHLFTREFWAEAGAILAPDGIVVMNIAGEVHGPMTRRIVATLTAEFPHCRGFTDAFMPSAKANRVKNMVFFCSPTSPVKFRAPTPADALGSLLRQRVYTGFEENEIALSDILDYEGDDDKEDKDALILRRGAVDGVRVWDLELAKAVWESVRALMPAHLWVTY